MSYDRQRQQCAECLCVPAECRSCEVCSQAKCCASIHSATVIAAARQRPAEAVRFFGHAKGMLAAALGIEMLCIGFAELGENAGLYAFGFNPVGIAIAFAMGYGLAGVATFLTILGRSSNNKGGMCGGHDGCCSLLDDPLRRGFLANLYGTLRDFARGAGRLVHVRRERNVGAVLKSSLVILVTAESACILTAETVGLLLYQYSVLVSVPLALLAGAFAIVAPQAWKKTRA